MKSILMGLALTVVVSTASATQADINTIIGLAEQIKIAALNTKASDSSLKAIIKNLQANLNTLNTGTGGGPVFNTECYKFAYDKYYTSMSSANATTSATAACKKVQDVSVLKFLYDKYYTSLSAASAIDEASKRSGYEIQDKLDMVKFAFDKNYSSLSSSNAATRAYDQISLVSVGNLGCLQSLFPSYYTSMSSLNAMDATAKACQ